MKIELSNVTIGSDPEYGAIDQNGVPKSVVGFLPGTKKDPFDLGEDVSCQIDNVGAECCIPPCSTEDEFVHYMTLAKVKTEQKLQELAPHLTLVSKSSQRYENSELASDIAMMFGCEPSYCVYTKDRSPRPSPDEVGNLRSFGFHIHIGFPVQDGEDQIEYVNKIIQAMDAMVGVPSIVLDTDADRRNIYGNAGDLRFRRIKDVLVIEYRTLGGAMHATEELLRFVYRQTIKAVELVNNWDDSIDFNGCRNVIDTGNVDAAIEMCQQFNITLPATHAREFAKV